MPSRSLLDVADKHRLSAVYIVRLMEAATEAGSFDLDWMLARIGLSRRDLEEKDARCTVGHRLRLLHAITTTNDIPGLGLLAGRRIMVPDHGIVGYAILSSANLRSVMDTIARFHQLSNPTVRFRYHLDGQDVVIDEAPIFPFDDVATRYHLEEMLAAWLPIGALLQPGSLRFTQIRVPWARPKYHHLYEQLFRCPIAYNQPDCGARFPAALLDEPISLANPEMALLCEQQCDIIAHEQCNEGNVVYQVQRVLLNQPGQFPPLEDVARKLNMSSRTLRRYLVAERATFRGIVGNLRMTIAAKYLKNTKMPSQSIAALLGYSDAANFHRAFKKSYGETPETFRRHLDSAAPEERPSSGGSAAA
ncbi:MAG: AraC family transcriptional regulator [Steroidobacteraceae bacterium]|nr:AraC family transcriptional regulator [Steroidobacteraceae bacterium]